MVKKKEDDLLASIDLAILNREECDNLNEQFFPKKFKELSNKLCQSKQPLNNIIVSQW